MNSAVSFAAGLGLGVLAGWGAAIALRPEEAPAATPPSVAPERAPTHVAPLREKFRRPKPESIEPAPATKPVDRAPILESGDAYSIRQATAVHDEREQRPFSDAELAAATARLATARDAGDAPVFLAVLRALGESKDARARAKVVDVLGDPSYPLSSLRDGAYDQIERWLKDGDSPAGAGAAARRRIEANRAAGDVNAHAYLLLRMVARHGDADDLAWLAATTASREIGELAVNGLTQVPRDETAPIVAKLLAAGKLRGDQLVDYASNNPGPAWELVVPLVGALKSGAPLPKGTDPSTIFRAYGAAAPVSALAQVRECLTGLRTLELRVRALAAVQALADRKIDVAPFQLILDAPIDLLAQAGDIDLARGHVCVYGIKNNRVAWSIRAAEALEAAAPRAGKLDTEFRDTAREIRNELTDPWRRK